MINWFHRLLKPHCPECSIEKICLSCETLRDQLARVNEEKKLLLESILESVKPKVEAVPPEIKIEKPSFIPWRVKKEMLEAEDREKARLLKNKQNELTIEDLEKEMDIAAQERENKNAG